MMALEASSRPCSSNSPRQPPGTFQDSFSLPVAGCPRSLYLWVLLFTRGPVTSILHRPMVRPTNLAQLQSCDHSSSCVCHSTLQPHNTFENNVANTVTELRQDKGRTSLTCVGFPLPPLSPSNSQATMWPMFRYRMGQSHAC